MKKTTILGVLLLCMLFFVTSAFAQGMQQGRGQGMGNQIIQNGYVYEMYDDTQMNHSIQIDTLPYEDLSEEEVAGLILMREEEKLARDVYLYLYDMYGMQVFSNIAQSESTHTQAVKSLLDKYEINDPVADDTRGIFTSEALAALYESLTVQGSESLLDALIVGATIEDLDIADLQKLSMQSDNQDIKAVYANLERGSRNHLRSFTKVLQRNGGSYESTYISVEEYETIVQGEMERGSDNGEDNYFTQENGAASNEQQQQGNTFFGSVMNMLRGLFR